MPVSAALWLVGQWRDDGPWEFAGVYSARELAVSACRTRDYFVGQITLDETVPSYTVERTDWVYPLAEKLSYLVDPNIPSGEVHFLTGDREMLGKIINLATEEPT